VANLIMEIMLDHGDHVRSDLLGVIDARTSNLGYIFAIV
jgi:hypothetical protein